MKRGIAIIISFMFFLTGCAIKNEVPSFNMALKDNERFIENQKYSFGPMADLSKVDNETKSRLQQKLNNMGNVPKDELTFNPIKAYCNKDGSLVVDLFIRNGHKESIFNIDAKLKLVKSGRVIAEAPFNFIKDEFGVIDYNDSRPWTILYYPEDVRIKDVKLDGYTIEVENIQYEY